MPLCGIGDRFSKTNLHATPTDVGRDTTPGLQAQDSYRNLVLVTWMRPSLGSAIGFFSAHSRHLAIATMRKLPLFYVFHVWGRSKFSKGSANSTATSTCPIDVSTLRTLPNVE